MTYTRLWGAIALVLLLTFFFSAINSRVLVLETRVGALEAVQHTTKVDTVYIEHFSTDRFTDLEEYAARGATPWKEGKR